MPSSPGWRLHPHQLHDDRAPVAALRHILLVPEPVHQLRIRPRDARRGPAGRARLAREPVARHRRNHDVEGIRRVPAMRRGIGERLDQLQQLDERAWPPVAQDDRQRVLVLRADMDEVDVQPVDLGDEVRQRLDLRLELSEVVVIGPVLRERLDRPELHALRGVVHRLLLREARGLEARLQVLDVRLVELDGERTDRGGDGGFFGDDGHGECSLRISSDGT